VIVLPGFFRGAFGPGTAELFNSVRRRGATGGDSSLCGLSTKIHALVDGNGRPPVLLVAPGQGGDAPMFPHLMSHLTINRGRSRQAADPPGPCAWGQGLFIPEPADQIGHRKRRGSAGGRPPAFDKEDYKGRNVVERNFNTFKQWRGLATRYDKLAPTYRGGAVLRAVTGWPL
jgi:transposase